MNLPEKIKEPYLLSQEEIETAKEVISPDWKIESNQSIKRLFKFSNFKKALNFVNEVGKVAEEMNHHPDILLSWGKVEINCSTHSVNGLSNKDFLLAEKSDAEFATFK